MNRKWIYSLLMVSVIVASCDHHSSSSSSSVDSSSSIGISDASDSSTSNETRNYQRIQNVSALFETYEKADEYNYIALYQCDTIANREYQGGWETSYMFDGINMLLTYTAGGANYTDYFIYDQEKDQMIYYLDAGNGKYQYLDMDNEYYFNYVAYIDYFELAGIEWEEDMQFDLENKVCIPIDDVAKDRVGRMIFGDNPNEYWHKVEVYWEDGYISRIEAISIYQEVTYYYTVTLSDHGYTEGSVKVPENAEEFTNPYQPYLKGKEEYTGDALSSEQANALNLFTMEQDMNYTVDIRWTFVYEGIVQEDSYLDFHLEAEDGNYMYSYADGESSLLTHYFYLLSNPSNYPVCFADEDFDGTFSAITYGMDEYEAYVGQIYLDRVLLYGFDSSDFIYDETKGYITAKDEATEEKYCTSLFYYQDTYGGLRIYLKEDESGNLVLDKIVTSFYTATESGSYYSFVKTYTFSSLHTTSIDYPDGVSL